MVEEKPDCPGHEGKCKFCKEEKGKFRYVGKMKEINRMGRPIVDYCCDKCQKNDEYARRRSVGPDIAMKLKGRTLRGDQL